MDNYEIVIDLVTLRDNVLNISGYLNHGKSIIAACNGQIIGPESFNYPTRSNNLVKNFDFKIPVSTDNVEIILKVNGDITSSVEFRKTCYLSDYSRYFIKYNKIVYYNGSFNVVDFSYYQMIKFELKDLVKILFSHEHFFIRAIFYRLIFLILYPIMKNKKIWLIMDRKRMADDNAEHFFKYALNQKDDVKKYFTICKGSEDYIRLNNEYKNILDYESFKHRFYYIFADKIISSQGSEFYLNPFMVGNPKLTSGISQVDFYFLQHGIIKDNISTWLRKYDRNPKLIVTSTNLEYESLFDEGYFYDKETVQILGLPRYDNLEDNYFSRRQIIIMPSWRNYLTDEESFLNSEFYKRFNNLINNEKLINYAEDNNYQIIFKPHPELIRFNYLFDKNYYVKFGKDSKYQNIFNDSSLLVTDYSSVFFDFAYLKKPVIYYQYNIDYHYNTENSYFDYETMGFGDIFDDEDDLVDKIIEYIDKDCEMEELYKKRVDNFFKYHDKNNSKRCYDWIYNH